MRLWDGTECLLDAALLDALWAIGRSQSELLDMGDGRWDAALLDADAIG